MGTGKKTEKASKQGPKLVGNIDEPAEAEMAKTELGDAEAPQSGMGLTPPQSPNEPRKVAFDIVGSMVRKMAIVMIQDEIKLYEGLVADAETLDDKLKVIQALSKLKLEATGHVLAGMAMARGGDNSTAIREAVNSQIATPTTNQPPKEGADAPSK